MFKCLSCGGKMDVNKQYGKYQCLACGRFMDGTLPPDDPAPDGNAPADDGGTGERWVLGGLLYNGEMTSWLRSLVESLRAQLDQGQRDEALGTCRRLLQMDRHFIDAHLWIARLSDDPAEQEKHAGHVLALQPGNLEATRLLMVLRGEITAEEAERSQDLYHDNVQVAGEPVEASTDVLLCPICRGGLTVSDGGEVACAFCGYKDDNANNAVRPTPETSLTAALIKQRGKAVRWKVGERMSRCTECGAERVLPVGKMSGRCPFCNSSHVIAQDLLGAFRQPDGIVKFKVKRQQAEDALDAQLEGNMERLKGLFINNKVERIGYSGVFLPFWVFDIFGKVLISDTFRDASEVIVEAERQETTEQLHNAMIPAVDSPPRSLTKRLGRYNMGERIPYTPKLLSKFAAELYVHDFDKASLEAREVFRQAMVEKNGNYNPNRNRSISTRIDYMEMQLLLLPVWVATIIERDGDVRTALINGQTGRVVLGKARKS